MALRATAAGQHRTRTVSLGNQTRWSVSGWFKISVNRNDCATMWCWDDNRPGTGDGQGAYLQTADDGRTLEFASYRVVGGTGPFVAKGTRLLTVGTWYYVGVSVNGGTGVMVTRAATDTTFAVTTWTDGITAGINPTTMRLGESVYGGEWLDGSIAAVKWWTSNLTQAELETEAWTTTPRRTDGLHAWYPLSQVENVDYSGNGQTLTGTGGATEDGPPIAWRPARRRIITRLSVNTDTSPPPILGVTSIPSPGVSLGITRRPPLVQGAASVPTPDVFVGSSPPTNVRPDLVRGAASIPRPTVATDKNVTLTPALLVARAAIPAPAVKVPINAGDDLIAPGMLSFNGFVMGGPGSPYRWQRLTGAFVDMPAIDNGNVPHPSAPGAMSGQKLAQARIINLEFTVRGRREEIEQISFDLLAGLPLPDDDGELPLAIRVGDKILVGKGACLNRQLPIDKNFRVGLAKGAAMWELSNPRLYSRELLTAVVPDGGTVEVWHAGNTSTHPLIRCPGPANGPELVIERVLDDGSDDMRVVGFDLEVEVGQTLIIDPINGNASIGDDDKIDALTDESIGVPDFVLGRDESSISYSTQGGGAPPATVLWRHAHN
ncbi:LamG-like jellyroll fold domain-containing protein [Streptosporangium sp. NPDC087985]|uniref:LamG-like jellyroll fold domain-containing protein n=1 Tax=Streptosporangium sp. NPDC087985 TaxID=3366196 RepID=UPI00382F0C9F